MAQALAGIRVLDLTQYEALRRPRVILCYITSRVTTKSRGSWRTSATRPRSS